MAVYTEDVRCKIMDWFAGCYDLQDVRELYNTIRTESDKQYDLIVKEIVRREGEDK